MFSKFRKKMNSIPLGVKASVSYTVCSIFQRCLSFITMPLFTRLLTTEQYGQYSVYQSWSSILMIFTTLNLAYGSFSKAMIKFEDDRKGYIAAVQNICLLLNLIFLAIYFPFQTKWNQLFGLPTPLVVLMVAEIVGHFAMSCWYAARKFDFRYKSAIALTVLNSLISPALAYVLVVCSQEKGYARILGYAVFPLVVGALLYVAGMIKGKGGFNKTYWKYALGFNIPLLPYYLSQVIFNQSDRIMIDHICGTDKAGIYTVAYTLGTILLFVLNAINNSYVPWFYQKIRDGKGHENKNIATGIAILMAFMLLGVIALAPEVILLMAGRNYYEAIWVVPPVAMSILLLFYSQLFINVEFYYEEKTMLVWGSIGAAVLNVVLNAILIPRYGFVAAGYTTLVSYIAFAVANYYTMTYICRKQGMSCDYYSLKELILLFVVFSALSFLALALYECFVVRYCIIVAVLIGLVVFNKKVMEYTKRILVR